MILNDGVMFSFLSIRSPPNSTRTDPLLPYPSLFLSTPAAMAGRTWPPTTASSTDPYPRHLHGNGHGRSHEPVRATIAVPGTAPDRRRSIHRQGNSHDIRHLRPGNRTGGLSRTVRAPRLYRTCSRAHHG